MGILRRSFKKAVQLALKDREPGAPEVGRYKRTASEAKHGAFRLKKLDEDLTVDLARQMEAMDVGLLRKIRAGES